MGVKDTIPTVEALTAKISADWTTIEQRINQELTGSWQDFTKARRNFLLVLGAVSIVLGAVYFSGLSTDFWSWIVISAFVFVFVYKFWRGFHSTYTWYTFQLDKLLHEFVFDLFSLSAIHRKVPAEEIRSALAHSALVTDRVDTYKADDFITTSYLGGALELVELHLTRTEKQGKNTVEVEVFKGVFVSYELPTMLTGVTYVSTEGDKYGFGHRSFWGAVTNANTVEETELEWNEFERDLHVATSDPTEARYILTPDFMLDLHTWWKARPRNIRMVFKENKLYLLFPDRKVLIGGGLASMSKIKQQQYTATIAEPIWHTLELIDDVRTRFR